MILAHGLTPTLPIFIWIGSKFDSQDLPPANECGTGLSTSGPWRTSACALHMSAFDPKRTLIIDVPSLQTAFYEKNGTVVNRTVVGSLSFFGNQMAKKIFSTNKSNPERQTVDPLAESEARYRRLVEAVVDYAIFQLDASGRITSWNPGAQKIKGYEQSEIIGKHLELPARGSVDRNVSVLLKWPRTAGIGSRVSFAIDNAFIRM